MGKKEKSNIFIKSVVLSGLCCIMFCSAAAANDMDTVVMNTFSSDLDMIHEEDITYSDPNTDYSKLIYYDFDESYMENAVDYVPDNLADCYIVYKDGTTEKVEGGTKAEEKHDHIYEKVNIDKHSKHSDGSCTLKVYAAKKCTICGKTIEGELIYETNFPKCPH